jgi:hypothetical protein
MVGAAEEQAGEPLAGAFLPDRGPRRPLALSLLALFDLVAGLLMPAVLALCEHFFFRSRASLALGPFSIGLCWGAGLRVWKLKPGARAMQTLVCWLGMLCAPPVSTVLFLPALLLTRRPAVRLLLSGKRLEQLDPAEVSCIAAFVATSERWASAIAVPLAVAAGTLLAILSVAIHTLEVLGSRVDRIRTANEAAAMADVRMLLRAEERFAALNGGLSDVPACLAAPARCREGAASFLPLPEPLNGERAGYARHFYPGRRPDEDEIRRRALSPSSLLGYAYVATPLPADIVGGRAFCADATGLVRFNLDGTPPAPLDGACPTTWLILADAAVKP